jgi:hypothetical protein
VKPAILSALAITLLVGCHKHREAEGPAEKAGASVDDAARKTGDALHKAAVKTDEAAHQAVTATGKALEKAGQKLKGSPSATQPKQSAPASTPPATGNEKD